MFAPFKDEVQELPDDYLSLSEYAAFHHKPVETVRTALKRGRFFWPVFYRHQWYLHPLEFPNQRRRRAW